MSWATVAEPVAPSPKFSKKSSIGGLEKPGALMSVFICRCGATAFLLVTLGARADTLADWADQTTEIATDGPNTIRTMALAQSAVYEAVNAITSRYPRDRVDLGPADGASIDAAIVAASRTVLLHEAPNLRPQTDAAYDGCAGSTSVCARRKTCSQNTPTIWEIRSPIAP
jgi:hypothetical protein